jgi:PPOX class probable F420-dependent enzyme
MSALAQFARAKYLNLETYRKDGAAVRTPLWFAMSEDGGTLYAFTLAGSGKVKRIRRSARARIAPCDFRGNPRGTWLSAQARLVEAEDEIRLAHRLLDRKYFPKRLSNLWRKLFPKPRAVIAIRAE